MRVEAILWGALWLSSGCLQPTEGFIDPRLTTGPDDGSSSSSSSSVGSTAGTSLDDTAGETTAGPSPGTELLLDWDMAQVVDGAVLDQSGQERHLTLRGASAQDGYVAFDGIDDFAEGPDLGAVIPELTGLTYEARVRIDDTTDDWVDRAIIGILQQSAPGNYPLSLFINTAGTRTSFLALIDDTFTKVDVEPGYELGRWHTFHAIYDGQSLALFIDGELAGEPELQVGSLDGVNELSQVVYVGGYDGDVIFAGRHLRCDLARVRIWGRALSAEEVAAHHEHYAME